VGGSSFALLVLSTIIKRKYCSEVFIISGSHTLLLMMSTEGEDTTADIMCCASYGVTEEEGDGVALKNHRFEEMYRLQPRSILRRRMSTQASSGTQTCLQQTGGGIAQSRRRVVHQQWRWRGVGHGHSCSYGRDRGHF